MAFERPFLKLEVVLGTLACTHCLVPSPLVALYFLHDHCLCKSTSAIKTKAPESQELFSSPGHSIPSSHACCTDWEQVDLIPSALSLSISPRSSTVSEIPSLPAAFWLSTTFFFSSKAPGRWRAYHGILLKTLQMLSLFYKWGNEGLEKRNDLPRLTQLISV